MAEEDTSAVSKEILLMERSAIHRISSGQGILDLAGAVKELVENSLDAGANRIDIRLKEYGADLIEVADNGPGVSPKNYQALTLKYYTSKISKFTDLQNLSSFGFRGEALSSLCALSRVTISTRRATESVGTRLEYDLSGILVTRAPIARCVGTTVAVSKLFFPLPVRENEFKRNIKREFGRLVTVLQAYALISKRIRLLCTNNTGKAGRTTVVQTLGSLSIRDNIVAVFGTKTIKCLEWIDLSISDECRVEGFLSKLGAGNGRGSRDRQFFFINGRPVHMPKAAKVFNELYRSFSPVQFPMVIINFLLPTTAYDINVSPDKRKVFVHNEGDLMKGLTTALQKDCAPGTDATTTTTAKKKRKKIVELPPIQQAVPPEVRLNGNASVTSELEADGGNSCGGLEQQGEVEREEVSIISTSDSAEYGKHSSRDRRQDGGVEREEAPRISTSDSYSAGYGKDSCGGLGQDVHVESEEVPIISTSDLAEYGKQQLNLKLKPCRPSLRLKSSGQKSRNSLSARPPRTSLFEVQPHSTVQSRLTELVSRCKRPLEVLAKVPSANTESGKEETNSVLRLNRLPAAEVKEAGGRPKDLSVLKFDMQRFQMLSDIVLLRHQKKERLMESRKEKSFTFATISDDCIAETPAEKNAALEAATKELEQILDKADIKRMKEFWPKTFAVGRCPRFFLSLVAEDVTGRANTKNLKCTEPLMKSVTQVVGQFDLRFILVKLDQNLFILDQHASDEIYNFEHIMRTAVLDSQQLSKSVPLELNAADRVIVETDIKTFRKNGFDFRRKRQRSGGHKLHLSAVPSCTNDILGVEDVKELISFLASRPSGGCKCDARHLHSKCSCISSIWLPRPSRLRAILASEACKSSRMVGDALSKKEMKEVVSRLAELEAPWTCPHGRPTIRHMFDLGSIVKSSTPLPSH